MEIHKEQSYYHLKLGQLVALVWADTRSKLGWSYDPREERLPGYIASIGYVVQTNPECVTITTSMDDKGCSLDDLSIPAGCIRKVEVLEGGFLERKKTEGK
jgi:hypothetical protein